MDSKCPPSFSVLPLLPLLLLASCAQLAGYGGADAQHDPTDPADPARDAASPPSSPHDGSLPVDAGPTTPLPPSTTDCSADLKTDPNNCGYCKHRCFAGNTCSDGVCDSNVVATATTLDSVGLAAASVLVGDATTGKIRLCPRGGLMDACLVVASGTGVGTALGVIDDHFAYYDKQASRVVVCLLLGCGSDSRDLGTIDVGTSNAPVFAPDGTWVLWAVPAAVATAPLDGQSQSRETDTRLARSTHLSAHYEASDHSTTVAGATSTGAWALRLPSQDTGLTDGKKRMITTTASNAVLVESGGIWSAQNDGLYRAPIKDEPAAKIRDGAFTAIAASTGVAYGIRGGNVVRIQEGAPDIVLATNATRVLADDTDDFVYFTRGNELRRVPR